MSEELNKEKYPGVELAYPLAATSYDVALKRLDAMDGRLQTILAFIVATSAAVPALGAGRIHFRSWYFYAAVVCFALAVLGGTLARLLGKVKVLVPRHAFNHWLHKPDWEFKMDFINQAAIDFEQNATTIERKWRCSLALTLLFFVQTAFLAAWVLDNS
ncbi:MAG TPA: hypothetical protein VJU84_05350 [Pyrinomonadaceae bacterium]|nr:hypothetical protein [Pyrinomonadaceae bacterium]